MRKLLLVRHSHSQLTLGLEPARWPLSADGRRRVIPFAASVSVHAPFVIVTSEEPKAVQTGSILAEVTGMPFETYPGLHEHERPAFDRFSSQADFEMEVERLFDHPESIVYGLESASQAMERYRSAIHALLEKYPNENIAVVSHGTVMTLFVAAYNSINAKAFWRGLQMPDLVVLELPGFTVAKADGHNTAGPHEESNKSA